MIGGHMSHYILQPLCLYIYTYIYTEYYISITNHHIIWRMLDNCAKGWQVTEFCHPGESLAKHQHKMMESIALSSVETFEPSVGMILVFYIFIHPFFSDDMG